MRIRSAAGSLLGMAVALGLCACSDSGGPPTPDRSSGVATVTAACSVAAPFSAPTPTPAAGLGTVRGRVGVIIPRTSGEARPSGGDARFVAKALEAQGVTVDVSTPGSPLAFVSSAQQMIDAGVTVLIVVPGEEALAERSTVLD